MNVLLLEMCFVRANGDLNDKPTAMQSRLMARSQCRTTVLRRTRLLSAPDVNSTDNNQPWKKACCVIPTRVHPHHVLCWSWAAYNNALASSFNYNFKSLCLPEVYQAHSKQMKRSEARESVLHMYKCLWKWVWKCTKCSLSISTPCAYNEMTVLLLDIFYFCFRTVCELQPSNKITVSFQFLTNYISAQHHRCAPQKTASAWSLSGLQEANQKW